MLPSSARSSLALGVFVLAVGIAGCQMGPSALKVGSAHYSEAVRSATSEQLLLNLVRLRYRDMPVFLNVASISTQFEFRSSGAISGSIVENGRSSGNESSITLGPAGAASGTFDRSTSDVALDPDTLGLNASAGYSEKPTITFSTLGGEEFQRRMLEPLEISAITLVAESGWRGDRILRMTVEGLNGLKNVPRASGPTPDDIAPEDFEQFREAVDLLTTLSQEGLIRFEFETRRHPISTTLPADKVTISDYISASEKNLGFTVTSKPAGLTLVASERELRLRVPRESDDPRIAKLRDLLRLEELQPDSSGRYDRYAVVALEDAAGQVEDKKPAIGQLAFNTRSLMGVLYYLSNGVEPPVEHERTRVVTVTRYKDGMPFDWSEVIGDLFRVQSSKWPPSRAAVAVRHRGYWFYIADNDETSKSTFLLLQQLFTLTAGEIETQKPTLTLPVGG